MSKTNSIKSLLLEAWRMRWNEVQWGINIKKVLPRGVSGDVYDLADCILQQGLVGPTPNLIFIGYLKHCISAQLVSFGAGQYLISCLLTSQLTISNYSSFGDREISRFRQNTLHFMST